MLDPSVESHAERTRVLNAVALQNAVLCAECDVVSDSPHDTCMVCGSRSLFNIARVLGGNLPHQRASLIRQQGPELVSREIVLTFAEPRRARRRPKVGSRQLSAIPIERDSIEEVRRPVLVTPHDR
jgi:hypothetical protein